MALSECHECPCSWDPPKDPPLECPKCGQFYPELAGSF